MPPTTRRTRSAAAAEAVVKSEPEAARGKRKRGAVKAEDEGISGGVDELLSTPPPSSARVKKEESLTPSPSKKQSTVERKLASYKTSILASPFPDHPLPTAVEAERVAWILGRFHGYTPTSEGGRGLPRYTMPKGEDRWGGCGDVPSVLDAVVRTVLSCNTSNRNSAAAHQSMTEHFGRNNWSAIHAAPESELVEAIRCGGLANNKARTIKGILNTTMDKYGKLSLDHLHEASDDEIMQELVSFNGVGPKVASCVLAFCIGRESMAVDTHVFRLCKALGWVPEKANRDQTYYHLHERVPGHLKYALHVLLIMHGKRCANCSAKGFATVKEEKSEEEGGVMEKRECPLKKAGLLGRKGKALKEAAEQGAVVEAEGGVKNEEEAAVKVKKEEEENEGDLAPPSPTPTPAPGKGRKRGGGSGVPDYAANLRAARKATPSQLLSYIHDAGLLSPRLSSKGFSLELLPASSASSEQRKRIFALFEDNMKSMYRNSTLGWKPSAKKRELFDSESRLLIIRPPPEEGVEVAAFAMFRFDTEPYHPSDPTIIPGTREGEVEVVYLYEIQVRKQNQGDGLGGELMQAVYELGRATGMRKVMLTVFDENKGARRFYDKQGYEVDPNSPSLDEQRRSRVDFETMFKIVE